MFPFLLSVACVDKGGNVANRSTGDTIKVGVYVDLTGQTASFGQSTKNGIELAVGGNQFGWVGLTERKST